MITGSCCCGAVRLALSEPPLRMFTCHCSRCRKLGAITYVMVRTSALRLLAGASSIACHDPAPPYSYRRYFCRLCGSPLGEMVPEGDTIPIAANLLDGDPGVRNSFHEYVEDKPVWYDICDRAPQYAQSPPRG